MSNVMIRAASLAFRFVSLSTMPLILLMESKYNLKGVNILKLFRKKLTSEDHGYYILDCVGIAEAMTSHQECRHVIIILDPSEMNQLDMCLIFEVLTSSDIGILWNLSPFFAFCGICVILK